MQTVFLLAASVALLYILQLYISFRQAIKAIGNVPGDRLLISPVTVLGNLIPRIPGVSAGVNHLWKRKYSDFEYYGCDVIADVAAWPQPRVSYNLADADAIKEVTQARARWPKPTERYGVVSFFGQNIVATEGDEWKKHRKVAAPAFSEPNNKLVWEETVRIMLDLFDNVWGGKDEVVVEHTADITLSIALLIIGSAGFGRRISWEDDLKVLPGHHMSFKDALHAVSTLVFLKVLIPSWLLNLGLTKRMRTIRDAFEDLRVYMQEMIDERKNAEKKDERHDLFSSLLDASEDEVGEAKLIDSELTGNIFIFLLAGHETTAHTLCFTLALLALHQDEQEILYQHINTVLAPGQTPSYTDMNSLTQSMAVIYETLRMYPPVTGVPKKSAEDTTFSVTDASGARRVMVVPKGADVTLNAPGLHYNPRYWKDPYAFRPQRFNEDWPRDAFIPFSSGARSCLGRRFSETESVAILTMLVQRFRIEVKEEPRFVGETPAQRAARILDLRPGITLTPVHVPLVFKRRAGA